MGLPLQSHVAVQVGAHAVGGSGVALVLPWQSHVRVHRGEQVVAAGEALPRPGGSAAAIDAIDNPTATHKPCSFIRSSFFIETRCPRQACEVGTRLRDLCSSPHRPRPNPRRSPAGTNESIIQVRHSSAF